MGLTRCTQRDLKLRGCTPLGGPRAREFQPLEYTEFSLAILAFMGRRCTASKGQMPMRSRQDAPVSSETSISRHELPRRSLELVPVLSRREPECKGLINVVDLRGKIQSQILTYDSSGTTGDRRHRGYARSQIRVEFRAS